MDDRHPLPTPHRAPVAAGGMPARTDGVGRAAQTSCTGSGDRAPDSALTRGRHSTRDYPPDTAVSTRQLDVLRLVAEGFTDREIAEALFISPRTASNHVAAIIDRLGVPSRAAAAARAIRLGLL